MIVEIDPEFFEGYIEIVVNLYKQNKITKDELAVLLLAGVYGEQCSEEEVKLDLDFAEESIVMDVVAKHNLDAEIIRHIQLEDEGGISDSTVDDILGNATEEEKD